MSGNTKQALAEMSVEAVAMVTTEARAMAAAMAAANAMATAVTMAVAVAMAMTASDSCIEGICVINAAVGAITMSMMAVKAAVRREPNAIAMAAAMEVATVMATASAMVTAAAHWWLGSGSGSGGNNELG